MRTYSALLFVWLYSSISALKPLDDKTGSVIQTTPLSGRIAAFGDFNKDLLLDIYLISGKELKVAILADDPQKEVRYTIRQQFSLFTATSDIYAVYDNDFFGSKDIEILLLTGEPPNLGAIVLFCVIGSQTCEQSDKSIEGSFAMEPLIADLNGDLHADLVVEINGTRKILFSDTRHKNFITKDWEVPKNYQSESGSGSFLPFAAPQNHAFSSFETLLRPKMILAVQKDKKTAFEVWYDAKSLQKVITTDGEGGIACGQGCEILPTLFIDILGDNKLYMVVPTTEGTFYFYDPESPDKPWKLLEVTDTNSKSQITIFGNGQVSKQVYALDWDLDGSTDLVSVIESEEKTPQVAVFLNTANPQASLGRTFSLNVVRTLGADLTSWSALDFNSNGHIDIIATHKQSNFSIYEYTSTDDMTFLKVSVADCEGNFVAPTNSHGAMVRYKTLTTAGILQEGSAVIMPKSNRGCVQPPYVIFGLGHMPNFIDELEVGLSSDKRNKSWVGKITLVIPNSQLLLLPIPKDKPSAWKFKLFIKPSLYVYIVSGVLLGICGILALISLGLQLKEAKEDKEEKLEEAQKFHFDAM